MALKRILGAIRKADIDYQLIQDQDKICVGVSGGKDSVLLLVALKYYQRIAEHYDHKQFSILGIHLQMGFPDMNFEALDAYCKSEEIPLIHYPTRLYDILKLHPDSHERISCSLCSTLKKGAIVKAAQEYGCNKTAFAHHADDAIETLFLNMMYGGRIATFTPAMHLSDQDMNFIRPLVYCSESEIQETVQALSIPTVQSTCPNDGFTKRQEIKDWLHSLYKEVPQARKNFLTSLSNQEQLRLWVKGEDWKKNI